MDKKDCPLCKISDAALLAEIEDAILAGFPKKPVAAEYGCSIGDVRDHMALHREGVEVLARHDYSHERVSYDKYEILSDNLIKIAKRLDALFDVDGLDKESTDQIIASAREIRQTVGLLANLEGEFKSELEMTKQQFNELKSTVMQIMEPEQQRVLIKNLEDIELEASR